MLVHSWIDGSGGWGNEPREGTPWLRAGALQRRQPVFFRDRAIR